MLIFCVYVHIIIFFIELIVKEHPNIIMQQKENIFGGSRGLNDQYVVLIHLHSEIETKT